MRHKNLRYLLPGVLLVLSSCAYFNTYYNAEQYFDKAEDLRLAKVGETVPSGALEAYKKVIAKTDKVIEKYPDSKYVYPAILLQGKARFYRGELTQAESAFDRLSGTGIPEYLHESDYWLALIKWKRGQPNPALNDLKALLKDETKSSNSARIYLSMAEIHLEVGFTDEAIQDLDHAAELSRTSDEKEQIYYRMAEMALKNEKYDEATRYYKSVIKNSLSKSRIMECNLQIVKILRLQGELKTAASRIKSMLTDDRFSDIYSDLELELAKLYQIQNQDDEYISRLESICANYTKTTASSEAYFLLAQNEMNTWNFEKAAAYFNQVGKEDRTSPFLDQVRVRTKEINNYLNLVKDMDALKTKIEDMQSATTDSTEPDTSNPLVSNETLDDLISQIPGKLNQMGELEAFHFNRPDSAILRFRTVYRQYPNSKDWAKGSYSLAYLVAQKGDTVSSDSIKDRILDLAPGSEFADAIMEEQGGNPLEMEMEMRMTRAEGLIKDYPGQALELYQSIFVDDSTSELAPNALYFLANYYDHIHIQPDSANYYYHLLNTYFPDSDQFATAHDRFNFYTNWETEQQQLESDQTDSVDVQTQSVPTDTSQAVQADTSQAVQVDTTHAIRRETETP